jgi:hypothetical protein
VFLHAGHKEGAVKERALPLLYCAHVMQHFRT